jgi:hypothetical protein
MGWAEEQRESYVDQAFRKQELAEVLSWPFFENLTFFQVWPGGWCLHGRPAVTKGQGDQKSMNFELPPDIRSPVDALLAVIKKVQADPKKLQEKIRWYCPEHKWETIVPRGEMHSGCPQCGGYYCEPYAGEE